MSDDIRKYKSSVPDANKIVSNEEHNDIKTETTDVGESRSNIVPIAELQTHNYVLKYGSPNNITPVSLHSINSNYNLTNSNAIETSLSLTSSKAQQQYITSSNTIISSPHLQNKMQPIVYDSNTIVLATQPRRQLNGPPDRTCKSNVHRSCESFSLISSLPLSLSDSESNQVQASVYARFDATR